MLFNLNSFEVEYKTANNQANGICDWPDKGVYFKIFLKKLLFIRMNEIHTNEIPIKLKTIFFTESFKELSRISLYSNQNNNNAGIENNEPNSIVSIKKGNAVGISSGFLEL